MFIYLLYLFFPQSWPDWISSIILPILTSSFHIPNLSVSLMYSTVCLMIFGSPNNRSIRIFPFPTSSRSFFLCSL